MLYIPSIVLPPRLYYARKPTRDEVHHFVDTHATEVGSKLRAFSGRKLVQHVCFGFLALKF